MTDLQLKRVLLVYDGVPDPHSAGVFSRFINVTFQGYNATDVQLTVIHPGAAAAFMMSGITFTTLTAGDTGLYINATDSNGSTPFLTINIDSTPDNCIGDFVSVSGGAVVNWTNVNCG